MAKKKSTKKRSATQKKTKASRGSAKPDAVSSSRSATDGQADESSWLSVDQAIEILNTSKPTFYRWLREGRLKGNKVGRQWRFKQEDLDRFLRGEQVRVRLPVDAAPLIEHLQSQLKKAGGSLPAKKSSADEPISMVADLVTELGAATNASDIHIEPLLLDGKREAIVRCRIDGVLHEFARFDMRLLSFLVDQFKTRAACDLSNQVCPQDGRTPYTTGNRTIDLRISFLPAALGQTMVIRLLDPEAAVVSLDRFDYSDKDRKRLDNALDESWGVVLVTGPTGSGKTTVLYSCVNEVVSSQSKVVSIEDPVEFILPGVTQVPVRPAEGIRVPIALRAMLRSDPDAIMVGELRDEASVQICFDAALTGHLVLSAMHTNSAAQALVRLTDIGIPPFVIAAGLKLVIGQRLLRSLCKHCRKPVEPDQSSIRALEDVAGCRIDDLAETPQFYSAVGCSECSGTGYRGRVAISEVLQMSSRIGQALSEQAPAEKLHQIAVEEGMTSLAADGLRRAVKGQTTLEEVMRFISGSS